MDPIGLLVLVCFGLIQEMYGNVMFRLHANNRQKNLTSAGCLY